MKKARTHIAPPADCTGCALCANVCPRDAISMEWNTDGFLAPVVNESRCVDCGLCLRACIASEPPAAYADKPEEVESYGAWNGDEELHHGSSSGGVFSALAKDIFSRGGCVFGVAWQDKETAVFGKAENMEELAAMRGSKYTPALPGYVYRQVREELEAGRHVLFSGTPCQVHALKAFLKRDCERLLTLDIVCHGVPSRLLLQKYIREAEMLCGKAVERIAFRDKPDSWLNFSVTRHYADGSQESTHLHEDTYMQMFLSNEALNNACYNCPYAHLPRQGDVSVGDYWGVQKYHPEWPVRWGVSALLVNTPKGRQLLEKLPPHILERRQEPFCNIYAGQSVVYVKPQAPLPPNRPYALSFLRDERMSLQQAIDEVTLCRRVAGIRLRNDFFLLRLLRLLRRMLLRR